MIFILLVGFNLLCPKYFIKSGSMEPDLKTGAIVWLNPHKEPMVNDVAAYSEGKNIVIHRVIEKKKDYSNEKETSL